VEFLRGAAARIIAAVVVTLVSAGACGAQSGGELRFTIRADPKTFDPQQVNDEPSDTVRYLTAGFLLRLNRRTHQLDPELAESWKVSEGGRRIDFRLRQGVVFSDGSPFSCADVAYTMRRLMDPATLSAVADSFRTAPGSVETKCATPYVATIRFPGVVAALDAQFDAVAMLSAKSSKRENAVLGPFTASEYRPGSYILLKRNPNYWRHDSKGLRLPYLDSVRLEIQQNRDTEVLRFRRGALDMVYRLPPDLFDQLSSAAPKTVIDAGPSLDWELVFFNQMSAAPLPDYKKRWFRSTNFRKAISAAINRGDICKVVYRGHAKPAGGPVSPSNPEWRNPNVKPDAYSVQTALDRLAKDGFKRVGVALVDSSGHPVEFSMITNAGNKAHERMMAMIQEDLAKVGIHLNVTALDFPSLIERISQTHAYESCLMAFTNVALDPNGQMNIWLSSSETHQWNPSQKSPETAWEADMDRLMRIQASTLDYKKRKAAFDRVQEIISEEAPFLFLVYPNSLAAVAQNIGNVQPSVVRPEIYWNIAELYKGSGHVVASR
jgi:peptide/nickel transport system substrate-binding protein